MFYLCGDFLVDVVVFVEIYIIEVFKFYFENIDVGGEFDVGLRYFGGYMNCGLICCIIGLCGCLIGVLVKL